MKNPPDQPAHCPDEFRGPFSIEIKTAGAWTEAGNVEDLLDALRMASQLADVIGEEKILITDADVKEVR